ncbi:hypothetical protein A2U01_0066521, partial [Trifolium medium]|nr:hypothetical protein [Trifolium medium]
EPIGVTRVRNSADSTWIGSDMVNAMRRQCGRSLKMC